MVLLPNLDNSRWTAFPRFNDAICSMEIIAALSSKDNPPHVLASGTFALFNFDLGSATQSFYIYYLVRPLKHTRVQIMLQMHGRRSIPFEVPGACIAKSCVLYQYQFFVAQFASPLVLPHYISYSIYSTPHSATQLRLVWFMLQSISKTLVQSLSFNFHRLTGHYGK
jgi:hypothetical protein